MGRSAKSRVGRSSILFLDALFGIDVAARLLRIASSAALCLALAGMAAATASAAGEIGSFSATASASQAGGHPDVGLSVSIKDPGAPETAKTLTVEMPAGLTGYFNSVPHCSLADLAIAECPPDSQVGLATTRALKEGDADFLFGTAPVFAVSPTPSGGYGRLAFTIPTIGFTQSLVAAVRTGDDYGLRLTAPNLPGAAPLQSLRLTLWGLPFDPVHDAARFPQGSEGCPGLADASCNSEPTASDAPEKALVGYPPTCGQTLSLGLELQTYQDPEHLAGAATTLPMATGCGFVGFIPSVLVQASSSSRTRSFLDVDFQLPQETGPFPTASPAKSMVIPLGGALRLDQAAVDQHAVCSAPEAGIGTEEPAACSAAAKIGSVRIETPVAPAPADRSSSSSHSTRVAVPQIAGSAYFGGPDPGGGYRVYLLPRGFGIEMKLEMLLKPDQVTGNLAASMPVLPPFPITEIDLKMPASTGVVETAVRCGAYVGSSTVTPWNQSLSPVFQIQPLPLTVGPGGTPCPGPPTQARVELAPSHVLADGQSTATATAVVTDKNGIPVPGETVEFSSTDGAQLIGPVTDHEDGTYTASIRASTAVGSPTITATVSSAEPELTGSALLRQDPIPSPPAPPSAPQPERKNVIPSVTIGRHPPRRTHRRRAVITFSADVRGSTFFCRLDGQPYHTCHSPTKLSGLRLGRHRFNVYAVSPSFSTGVPASVRFTVLAPRPRRHGGA
jgi:Invasin, domain 3